MIINLGHRLPDASSDLPEGSDGQPSNAFLFGLAPGGVYHAFDVTIEAVSSYLPFSPLPSSRWRYLFCGTFLGVTPTPRYGAPCPVELGLSSGFG